MSNAKPVCLIADIGGTNSRFALAQQGQTIKTTLRVLKTAAYAGLADAIRDYVAQENLSAAQIDSAVLAIAGPVDGDRYTLTNGTWHGDATSLMQSSGLRAVTLINDFAAIAYAIPLLTRAQLLPITGSVDAHDHAVPATLTDDVRAVIGPGTGFGTALVLPGQRHRVCAGEGGHASLALSDENDLRIAQWLLRHNIALTREALLTGAGIERLHDALHAPHHPASRHVDDIVRSALDGDAQCKATLDQFCAMLGTAARDIVLDAGARGGLYIAGGVVPHFTALLQQGPFRQRFEHNEKMHDYLRAIPTWLVTEPNPGLIGAAWYSHHGLNSQLGLHSQH